MADEEFEVQSEPAPERDAEEEVQDQHRGYEPTEEDYERARNEGIGREPELPPGVVRRES